MRVGVRGSTVVALAAFSAVIALLALTGGVAAGGGPPAGSTAAQADEAVNVTGRIVDAESGRSIDTGRVVLANRSADVRFAAETNATGAFEVAVDPDLTYRLRYTQEPNGFPIDGVVDKHSLGTVDVGTTDVDLGAEELPEAHRLNVTVVDEAGVPVEDAEVFVEGPPGNPGPDVGNRTDAQGRFVLGGTPGMETNGTVTVYAYPPEGELLERSQTRMSVTGDRAVRVVLARQVQVTGRIETAGGSAPAGYSVSLWGDRHGGDTRRVESDGEFDLAVAPNRTYRFGFEQTDWDGPEVDFPRDGVPDVHAFRTVSVGSEATSLGTNRLPRAHVLDVTVVDEDGDPVEGASMDVSHRHGEAAAWIHGRTTADGRLLLNDAPEPGVEVNGTVEIHVEPPDGTDLEDNETTITVTDDRDLRIVLQQTVSVSGRVLDEAGDSRADNSVVAFDLEAGEIDAAEQTNATGAFALSVASNDTYAVIFGDGSPDDRFPRNGVPDVYELAEVTPSTDVTVSDVTVPDGHVLDVRVVDGDGDPVRDAVVGVRSTRGDDARGATAAFRTDGDGFAHLDDRPYTGIEVAGPVTVEVNTTTADGSFPDRLVTRNLTVTGNITITVTVERRPTLVVDPDDPTAYDTIGAAVEDAPAGGTVRVATAVYDERVRIDEALTLVGAPGDATAGPAPDAPVLDGGGDRRFGVVLADGTSNVTVEGFEIRNYTGSGIAPFGRITNLTVRHSAIHDIDGGDFPTGVSTFQLDTVQRGIVVERNRFEAIGGDAVLLLNVHGAVVRGNTIVGTADVGTRFFGEGSAGGIVVAPWANRTDITTRNVRIENNTITGTIVLAGIRLFPRNLSTGSHARIEAVRVRNNTVSGPNVSRGVAIDPQEVNTSVAGVFFESNAFRSVDRGLVVDARPGRTGTIRVTGSVFANTTSDAIRIVSGNASGLAVHDSGITGSGGAGLNNSAAGTLNATRNWWGAPDGPGGAFDGSGDAVRGNATVRPFYVDAARTRLSSATLPPVIGDRRPLNPDGDGVYEDVNGDGDVTPGDATVLFTAVFDRNPAVTDNVAAFDFNGDGSVTPGDATVLFEEAF